MTPKALHEDTTIWRIVTAVSLVDIGPLDRTAGECFGTVNDVPQGVTVVRVIGQRPGMQHEQAPGSPVVVGKAFKPRWLLLLRADLRGTAKLYAEHLLPTRLGQIQLVSGSGHARLGGVSA